MAVIFFKNLGRSLLTSVLALIAAGIITVIIYVVCEELFRVTVSPLALIIIDSVLTAIGTVLWFCVAMQWEWFFSGEDDVCYRHSPHLIVGYLLLFLIFAVFGGSSALVLGLGYDKLITAIAANEDYKLLLMTLSSLSVSSFLYFIVMAFYYGSWQVCWHCGRMFCIDYHCTGSTSWDSTSYKTYTTKENIGSISAGNRKIADITGNVKHGYTETTHYTSSSYEGYCCHCRHGKSQSKLSTS